MEKKKMLTTVLLAGALGAGCASTGSESAGPGERYSNAGCENLRQIARSVKGNPDRQESARRDYVENCQDNSN